MELTLRRITKGKNEGKFKTSRGRIITEAQVKLFYPKLIKQMETLNVNKVSLNDI